MWSAESQAMLWTNMSLGLLFDPEDGSDVFLQNVV
jgi:hypothetical protein